MSDLLPHEQCKYSAPNCDNFHRLHYEVTPSLVEKMEEKLAMCEFGKEELFHDTFYNIGGTTNGSTIWLRRRRNLSLKSDPEWMMSESLQSESEELSRFKETYHKDGIITRLGELKIPYSTEIGLEKQFKVSILFRFLRRRGYHEEFGTVNIDETVDGLTLNFKFISQLQLDNIRRECQALPTKPPKFMVNMEGGPYSEHICGPRLQDVECELSEDPTYDETEDEEDEEYLNSEIKRIESLPFDKKLNEEWLFGPGVPPDVARMRRSFIDTFYKPVNENK